MEWGYKINGHCSEPRNKLRMVAAKTSGLRGKGGREKHNPTIRNLLNKIKTNVDTRELAQWLRALISLPEYSGSISSTENVAHNYLLLHFQ